MSFWFFRRVMLFSLIMLFVLNVCSGQGLAMGQTAPDTTKSLVIKDRQGLFKRLYFPYHHSSYMLQARFDLLQRARNGNPNAQHELGLRYLTGVGFEKDTLQSLYWVNRAAQQNHTTANYNMGVFYLNGWKIDWNPFKAFEHFMFAAQSGMPLAQYAVGVIYTENLVVQRNLNMAYYWMEKASKNDIEEADEVLAKLEEKGITNAGEYDNNLKKDDIPLPKTEDGEAIHTGNNQSPMLFYLDFTDDAPKDTIMVPADSTILQDLLVHGIIDSSEYHPTLDEFIIANEPSILDSIQEAALFGSPEALLMIGRMYDLGSGVPKNQISAAEYYLRATQLESIGATQILWKLSRDEAFFRRLKQEILKDNNQAKFVWAGLSALGFDYRLAVEEAFRFLIEAAEDDFIPAQLMLGQAYFSGVAVERNIDEARKYWKRAEYLGSIDAEIRLAMLNIYEIIPNEQIKPLLPLLLTAEEKGSILAQLTLGHCFEQGFGFPKNKGQAVDYYRSAALRGSHKGYYSLKRLYDDLRPEHPAFKLQ